MLADSLCPRVLKAKYFPNGSLLEATLKSGASFTWQSIMKGLETFKLGYIWRIGTGENVHIWRDPWIPASPDRKVITARGHTILSTVDELIDPNTNTWDEDLIRSIFNPVDTRRILQIPLSYDTFDDFIAWHPDWKCGNSYILTLKHCLINILGYQQWWGRIEVTASSTFMRELRKD